MNEYKLFLIIKIFYKNYKKLFFICFYGIKFALYFRELLKFWFVKINIY